MRAKFYTTKGQLITCYKKSSIWAGVKAAIEKMLNEVFWVVGKGNKIHVWRDYWIADKPLCEVVNNYRRFNIHTVNQLLVRWVICDELTNELISANINIHSVLTDSNKEDHCIWKLDIIGVSSAARAKLDFKLVRVSWYQSDLVESDLVAMAEGPNATDPAQVLAQQVGGPSINPRPLNTRTRLDQLEDKMLALSGIIDQVTTLEERLDGFSDDQAHMGERLVTVPPFPGEIKIACDGSSLGNPGIGGCGAVFRNNACEVLGVLTMNLSHTKAYNAECTAVVEALIKAYLLSHRRAWIVSDSSAAVKAFNNDQVPWRLRQLWDGIKSTFISLKSDLCMERAELQC
ncbi:hypothetical protein GIB67_011953 [Kingdonia uniflora]|uniref:RNase H type-1 domain-containing protein n=1 Tax=Kingdonia uniflora TaxID=39325 RepID=A0A7J7M071_9MAGN|nr:hypothetical protein GIB67_011953 [Kingdonia uniflora]